jgi:LysR family hydrogen peroxide-inducible transcriptional activator
MSTLTLRQLRYFEALVRHGQFGRAAEAVSVSQPALSVQVRDLEASLGAALFERGPRGVRLTAFGAAVAPRVRDILRRVDELGDLARAAGGGLTGPLRLGLIPTVAPYLLPRVVAAVEAAHPGVVPELREAVTPTLLDEVREGRLDAAVVALPAGERSLTEAPILREEFVLVRPAADRDAPVPTPEGLAAMRLLLLEEGHCFRDQALEVCGMRAVRAAVDGSSLGTLVQMVGAGLGVTLLPAMALTEVREAPVAVARFPDPAPSRTVGLVWRRASPLAPSLRSLAEGLAAAVA